MAVTTTPMPSVLPRTPRRPGRPVRALRVRAACAIGLVVVATLAASTGAVHAEDVALPAVTGPSPVGRTEITLTDTAREDPFATDGRSRELAVWIWYPAVPGSTGEPAAYLPSTWAELGNAAGVVIADLRTVRTDAIADAPLDGRPPVVVLLPGLGQPIAASTALAEDLASRGWAVVGINPTGSTSVVVFPDGRIVPGTPAGTIDPSLVVDLPAWSEAAARITGVWVADIAFVVKTLGKDAPPIGALDLSHPVYAGHSLGGAAAFEACAQDAACAAAVDLDGTLWTAVGRTGLGAPSLLLQADASGPCDAFCRSAEADFAVVEASGPAARAVIAGSRHMDFTDLGLLGAVPGALDLGTIDSERMTVIVRDLVGAFLDEHVRGATGAFEAAVARVPEVRRPGGPLSAGNAGR